MSFTISDWDGPGTEFTILDTVAYVDTVEIIVEFPLPGGLLRKLRRLARKRMTVRDATRPDRSDPKTRHRYGKIIALAQPTTDEFELVLAHCGNSYQVCRVDVAYDFHPPSANQATNCGLYLNRHGFQKWRGRTRRHNRTENVAYWSRIKRTTRNIALYYDQLSRKNGSPCTHWELRFITADACRRAGLSDLSELLGGINAMELLKHQTALMTIDRRRFFRWTEQEALRLKNSNRRAFEKWTVPYLQNRVHGIIFAALQDETFTPDETTIHTVKSQEIHDRVRLARKAMVKVKKWEELTRTPRWLR